MMMDEVHGNAEEPRTGIWATEVIVPSGAERYGEGLADQVFSIESAYPLQEVPL